jgi:1-aminocyclopropane-1-carboxylate deaminase
MMYYPEEVLVPWAARNLGRDVKWTEDRREHFVSSSHERGQLQEVTVGFDDDGRILALDVRFWHDNGAYTPYGIIVPIITATQLLGPYKPGAYRVEFWSLYTNTVLVTPYRGAGRPQGCYAMERTMDAVAAHLGLRCRLVQEKWVPWDDPVNDKVGNILLSRMMGADSRLDPHGFDIGIRDSWKDALREVEEAGGRPYAIPAGASEHPLGGVGFANWAFEVAEQERALGVHFDTIVVCTVTCSTHAGMVAGFAALEDLTGVRRRVIGIDASATLEKTRDQLERIARTTAEVIELGRDLRDDEFTLLPDWAGDLYGIPVDSTMEAMRLGAELEAMITDPVYEGKSLAGLVDLVRSGDIPKDSTVLYAHLGGQPAINAYHSLWPAS